MGWGGRIQTICTNQDPAPVFAGPRSPDQRSPLPPALLSRDIITRHVAICQRPSSGVSTPLLHRTAVLASPKVPSALPGRGTESWEETSIVRTNPFRQESEEDIQGPHPGARTFGPGKR